MISMHSSSYGYMQEVAKHKKSMKELHLRIYLCIRRSGVYVDPSFWSQKNKFFLFLDKNFLEKLIFYLRIQVRYGYTIKKQPLKKSLWKI